MSAPVVHDDSPVERFKRAIHQRDAAELRRVLTESEEARAAIDEPLFGFDAPALLSVTGNGDLALIDTLLEFGADPNRKSSWWAGGFHPLHAAEGDVAERLIAAGAVPDACAAARLDRADLLTQMIRENPAVVHERGGDGQTPLHFARSKAVVDLLLGAGADPDARDVDHRSTAAEWMIGDVNSPTSRNEIAGYLVERGASADIFLVAALGLADRARETLVDNRQLLRLRTGQGAYGEKPPSSFHISLWTLGANLSPLQVAAKRGHEETVRVMREFATPADRLLLAAHLGQGDEAQAIVRENPGVIEALNDVERRALTDEAWAPNPPAVKVLMELGFDPSVPSVSGPRGGNALHCASWEGSTEAVAAILSHERGRALVDTRESHWNGTPLSWCSHGSRNCGNPRGDHGGVAKLLIAAGATVTPDMRDWDGSPGFNAAIRDALTNG
jgi:ankyrin repeat protein